jgi:CheY-like chemotaxis protein
MSGAAQLPNALRVLVADDLAPNRLVVQALLAPAGHQVYFADSGSAAVSAVMRENYDIVLMDMHMPGMDGLEATRRIRALPLPKGGVPILGVTASTMPEEVAACYEAGMDRHLAKPIDGDALMLAMAELAAGQCWRAGLPSMSMDAPPLLNEITLRRTCDELGTMANSALQDMVEEIAQGCDVLAEPRIARDVTRMRQAAHLVMEPARSLGCERLAAGIDRLQRAIRAGEDVSPHLSALPALRARTLAQLEQVTVSA